MGWLFLASNSLGRDSQTESVYDGIKYLSLKHFLIRSIRRSLLSLFNLNVFESNLTHVKRARVATVSSYACDSTAVLRIKHIHVPLEQK